MSSVAGLSLAGAQAALWAWAEQVGAMLCVKTTSVAASVPARCVAANPAWARFAGRTLDAMPGLADSDWLEPGLASMLRSAEQTALAQREPLWSEHQFEWQGKRRDFRVLRVPVLDEDDGVPLLVCLWLDQEPQRLREAQLGAALAQIEQLQGANEQLRRELADQALRDQASGLHNRAHFEDQLRRELDLSTREQREFAIVFIDIDGSKERSAEDVEALLEAVGRAVRGGTRAMDASCRLEGQRFVLLLSGVGLATAHSRMEGLRRQCATQIVMRGGRELRFTVSMGVASFPHTAPDRDALMDAALTAVEQAQRRGGNQVALASIRLDAV